MTVLYVKYNRQRLPQFQIETSIHLNRGKKTVQKRALTEQAIKHVITMRDNYFLLKNQYEQVSIANCSLEGDHVTFEYIDGRSYESILLDYLLSGNKDDVLRCIEKYVQFIYNLGAKKIGFGHDPLFAQTFGEVNLVQELDCLELANIDMTFDNVILDEDGNHILIDYEWVFSTPIPIQFILYRSLNEFNTKHHENLNTMFTKEELCSHFCIAKEDIELFNRFEKNFQDYVFGINRDYEVATGDLEETYSIGDLMSMYDNEALMLTSQLEIQSKKIESLSNHYEEINLQLRLNKETLEAKIADYERKHRDEIDAEIVNSNKLDEQKKEISSLRSKEIALDVITSSTGWKALMKYYKFRDALIPEKSKRRMVLKLAKKLAENPKLFKYLVDKEKLKKFIYYYRTEDRDRLTHRLNTYIQRHSESASPEVKIIEQTYDFKTIIFPVHPAPRVSIVIPVYNQWSFTYNCLVSIFETCSEFAYEIIIADDVSSDETMDIHSYVENITVVRSETNKGFLRNCNQAAEKAQGEYIILLNNDTQVQDNWLRSLVELLDKDQSIGMTGSKLIYPDGRLQEAGGIIWNDASGWNYGRLDDPEKPEYNYVREVDYISAASIMIRADLWRAIGGFDERYVPAYFEDSDLAFEVRKAGFRVVYQPKSIVVHFEGISHGTSTESGIKAYQVTNKEKFIGKWHNVLRENHFDNGKQVFLARDRSKDKETILVIDHYVPHFDKDAGGRTVYQYLKLFVETGLRVIFVGDNYFKHEPYTSVLEQLGVEVLYGDWYSHHFKSWLKDNGQYIDYTLLNRPHISIKYIDIIKQYTNSKVIYYGHDLHFLRELREYEITHNKVLLDSSKDWKKIEFELVEKSDVIYYPSHVEISEIQKEYPHKYARAIPAYIFDGPNVNATSFTERKNLLFVGGFGHRPNVDAVLWFINEILPNIITQLPEIKLYIVGSNPPDDIIKLQSNQVIVTGFVTDEELVKYYEQCRMVIVPLRFGAGVKGKVVEALYYGMPLITTSIGAEGLENVDNCIIRRDDSIGFATQICHAYNDTILLEELSKGAKKYVNDHFSKENAISVISDQINMSRKEISHDN